MDLVLIGGAAFGTSILSALAGLGGGILLLVVIAQFLAPTTAIPIQGAMQLASNGSRAMLLGRDVAWRPVLWSSLLLFPASVLGASVATSMPEDATRLAMGTFVLVVAWRPQLLGWPGAERLPERALIGVGAVAGFLNSTVGASGPVTSPFFKAVTAGHTAFVATAAASQVIAHTSKIAAFSLDGFNPLDHAAVIGVGVAGVVSGSFVGTRLLGRFSEQRLNLLFKVVLTALAIRLIGQAALSV